MARGPKASGARPLLTPFPPPSPGEDTLEEEIVRGVPGEGTEHSLPPYFRLWVKSVLDRGIDGAVVADMLEERGMPLKAEHALYASQVRFGAIKQ